MKMDVVYAARYKTNIVDIKSPIPAYGDTEIAL